MTRGQIGPKSATESAQYRNVFQSFQGTDSWAPPWRSRSRWAISYRSIPAFATCIDAALIFLSAVVSGMLYQYIAYGDYSDIYANVAASVSVATLFILLTHLCKLYDPLRLLSWNDQLQNVMLIWIGTFIVLGGAVFSLGASKATSRGALLSFAMSGLVILLAHRLFWCAFINRALANGLLRGRNIVILGWISANPHLLAKLEQCGFRIQEEFNLKDSSLANNEDTLSRMMSFIRGSDIEEIFLISTTKEMHQTGAILNRLRALPIPVTMIADDVCAQLVRQPWHQIGDTVAVELQRLPLGTLDRVYKRTIDLLAAGVGLFLLMPLLVLVAIAIKLDSPGPIFFRQTRLGFNGRPFKIYKFRSMTVLEDGPSVQQATVNDSRVTRIGALIRKASIDEIPQLINVVRGEMSLVGPRPHAVVHDNHFLTLINNYAFRHHVKPGITGWAQVHGYRGETKDLEQMRRRVELDIWYVNNWSPWIDLSIALRTFGAVVRGDNAY